MTLGISRIDRKKLCVCVAGRGLGDRRRILPKQRSSSWSVDFNLGCDVDVRESWEFLRWKERRGGVGT